MPATGFPNCHKRQKTRITASDCGELVQKASDAFSSGKYLDGIDLIEQASEAFPQFAVPLLAKLYDIYNELPQDRYSLYQARHFNFNIRPGERVLDIGSGHLPFPHATDLAEYAVSDDSVGRAGMPFKHVDGKRVTECSVEKMPFKDKEFDFVYCSHVLEHVDNPEAACSELIRVAKRGYIETPNRAKDLLLNTAKVSNHRWALEHFNNKLVFSEYTQSDIEGLSSNLLMDMHVAPQSEREKAFSALVLLKSDALNLMLMWDGAFELEIRRLLPGIS